MAQIYLDYNASTPIDPVVTAAMQPFLDEAFGNPSSGHWASTPAKAAVERARGQVATLLGSAPDEIVFTSGPRAPRPHRAITSSKFRAELRSALQT